MTKKDLNNSENIDRENKAQEDWDRHHTTGDRYPDKAKGIGETDVKNAHASGDGAFGKSDDGLIGENTGSEEVEREEPPY